MDDNQEPIRPGVTSMYYYDHIYVQSATNAKLRTMARLNGERIDVNCRDAWGWTALHKACEQGHFDIVKYLLANGADPNIVNADLVTPLHLAAANGNKRCVEILLLSGARYQNQTKNGCFAKDYVQYESDIWKVLIDAESEIFPDPLTFPGPSDLPFVPKYSLPERPETPDAEKKKKAANDKKKLKK